MTVVTNRHRFLVAKTSLLLVLAQVGTTPAREQDNMILIAARGVTVGTNEVERKEIAERFDGSVVYPRMEFCTDNGAMIAVAGALRLAEASDAGEIMAKARWSLASLESPQSSREN